MLKKLVHDFEYIHVTLGVAGNLMFFAGSILFLEQFKEMRSLGVWLFIIGSALMLIGASGSAVKKLWRFWGESPRDEEQGSRQAA